MVKYIIDSVEYDVLYSILKKIKAMSRVAASVHLQVRTAHCACANYPSQWEANRLPDRPFVGGELVTRKMM
jgi:hypothetical protein